MGMIKLTHLPLDKMAAILADDIFKCICLNENNVPFISPRCVSIKKLRQRQNGRQFADDILKCISVNENVVVLAQILLQFVPKGTVDNKLALDYVMAWLRTGNKPLFEPMMAQVVDAFMRHSASMNYTTGNGIL